MPPELSPLLDPKPLPGPSAEPAAPILCWFCIRAQPKHEHVAAASLRKDLGLEIFLPRLRLKRATSRGPVWFNEALFPNYLFARFALSSRLLAVQHARGVRDIVHFGPRWPVVPDTVILSLQAALGPAELHVLPDNFQAGQPVQIAGGAFHGLSAIVMRVMPSQERIAVLLEFLGRQTPVELPLASVVMARS